MRRAKRAAIVLGGLFALAFLAGCDVGAEDVPDEAFYLEARIEATGVEPWYHLLDAMRGPKATGIRWWYRDAEHFRHEYYDPSDMLEWGPRWLVADGEDVVHYEPRSTIFHRSSLDDPALRGLAPGFPGMVGPLPGGSLDAFLADWRSRADGVEHVGTEDLLQRTVEVYEMKFTAPSSTEGGSGETPQARGGVTQFYIDVVDGFILRNTGEDSLGLGYDAVVTLLDLDPEFEDGVFDISLPNSAIDASASEDCGAHAITELHHFPTPAGWSHRGGGGTQLPSGCQWIERQAYYTGAEGEVLVTSQTLVPPTGVPAVRRDALPIDVAGTEGYRLTNGDLERLLWVQDEVIVLIESNAAPLEELLAVAESAE